MLAFLSRSLCVSTAKVLERARESRALRANLSLRTSRGGTNTTTRVL